jgi:hypothetical protein
LNTKRLDRIKKYLISHNLCEEVVFPEDADALFLQEAISYKDFNFIKTIQSDPFIVKYFEKLFTVNIDDSAVGFFKGIYNNIGQRNFIEGKHIVVPPLDMINELVFSNKRVEYNPMHLAAWRGNLRSNKIRTKLFKEFANQNGFKIECSNSWYNHNIEEKQHYVDFILNAKFSLCPAGWGPASFRIYESMALGRCPVIIADQFIPCFGPRWNEFALFVSEKHVGKLPYILQKNEFRAQEMGIKAKENWDKFFAGDKLIAFCSIAILNAINITPSNSLRMEMKYWNSNEFYYLNKWTITQRLVNKLKRNLNF